MGLFDFISKSPAKPAPTSSLSDPATNPPVQNPAPAGPAATQPIYGQVYPSTSFQTQPVTASVPTAYAADNAQAQDYPQPAPAANVSETTDMSQDKLDIMGSPVVSDSPGFDNPDYMQNEPKFDPGSQIQFQNDAPVIEPVLPVSDQTPPVIPAVQGSAAGLPDVSPSETVYKSIFNNPAEPQPAAETGLSGVHTTAALSPLDNTFDPNADVVGGTQDVTAPAPLEGSTAVVPSTEQNLPDLSTLQPVVQEDFANTANLSGVGSMPVYPEVQTGNSLMQQTVVPNMPEIKPEPSNFMPTPEQETASSSPEPGSLPVQIPPSTPLESGSTLEEGFKVLDIDKNPMPAITPAPKQEEIVANVIDQTGTEAAIPAFTAPIPETSPIAEAQVEDSTEKDLVQNEAYKDKPIEFFKNFAFVGLNVAQPNNELGNKVASLVSTLAAKKVNFLVDSTKGYGKNVVTGLNNSESKLTAVFLKPYYSSYSDESEEVVNLPEYVSVVFSNFLDRIKHVIKNSDIYVLPETDGIQNFSQFLLLWSLDFMYSGQHKPIVLLGKKWPEIINGLKSTLKFTEEQMALLNVCKDAQEAMDKIMQLDSEYKTKKNSSVKKILDMREENDEVDYFMSK